MGNQLVNSMVRGFGSQLGRKAANSLTTTRGRKQQPQQVSFSKKQLELINVYETEIKKLEGIIVETEGYYKDGKITQGEYDILKYRSKELMEEANRELTKLKTVKPQSFWSSVFIFLIGLTFFILTIKTIKGL